MILKENVQYDVTAVGELLIDFTQNGVSPQGNWILEANPGGAPCNVLAMLSRLGHKTAFIGKVGNDMFGSMLKKRVDTLGIDTTNLCMSDTYKTTLAFVHTATEYALETAKRAGTLLSFDPNLRLPLWDSEAHAKERIWYGLSMSDIHFRKNNRYDRGRRHIRRLYTA